MNLGALVSVRGAAPNALSDPRVVEAESRARVQRSPESRESLEQTLADVTLEVQADLAAEFDRIHSVERAREVGSLERILRPERMRSELIRWIEAGSRSGRKPS